MTDLPAFTLTRLKRTDRNGELGYGDVIVSGHLTVRFRLVSHGEEIYLVGPTREGVGGMQEVAKPSREFRSRLLALFLAEYDRLAEREFECRCGDLVHYRRGVKVGRSLQPHACP